MRNLLLTHMLLIPIIAFSQHKLTITGQISAEKSEVEEVKLFVVEIKNDIRDTVQTKKVIPHKHRSSTGEYSIDLQLNRHYQLIFAGGTFQETKYFEVTTYLNDGTKSKDYFLKEAFVNLWLSEEILIKKEGQIYFDKSKKEFKLIRDK